MLQYKGCEQATYLHAYYRNLTRAIACAALMAGFRLLTLPKLPWFRFWKEDLDWLNVAFFTGVLRGAATDVPAAWLCPHRKQLDASDLKQRCTLTLDVPRAALDAALNGGPLQRGPFHHPSM
jgi:hypothetical protein